MSQRRRKTNSMRESLSQPQPSTSRGASTFMEEDDDIPMTQAQAENATLDGLRHHVANTVKFILAADQSKVPITKASIPKGIAYDGKHFKVILRQAENYLQDVFGIHTVDDGTRIILINKIKQNEHLKFDEDISNKYVLLFLCLSHIYMSGGVCTEGSLESFLKRLSIIDEEEPTKVNEYFGPVLELIKGDFVKERYLEVVKRNAKEHNENQPTEYKWGLRAERELPYRKVMEFIAQVYQRDITSWPQHYDKMQKSEVVPPLQNGNTSR